MVSKRGLCWRKASGVRESDKRVRDVSRSNGERPLESFNGLSLENMLGARSRVVCFGRGLKVSRHG